MSAQDDWSGCDDANLMKGIAAANEGALIALMDRHAPSVIAVCARMLGDRTDAEDVAAEVFAELWRKRWRFEESRGQARSYIYLLARSRCLDAMRRRLGKRHDTGGPTLLHELAIANESTPLEIVELTDLTIIVRELLKELSDEQRETIELAFFGGMTHQQTAERLEMPLGTAKTHIRKGLAKLKSLLRSRLGRGD